MQLEKLKIAAIQMVSSADFGQNLRRAVELISNAVKEGAGLAVLPEYFAIMGLKEKDKFVHVESHKNGILQTTLKALAKKLNVWIVAGTHPIASDDACRPFGRCYVYDSKGNIVTWYDKIHLFDVEVGDNQGSYCESKYTQAGDRLVSFESPWGKIGLAVCYDLRFPELFRELVDQGCQIFVMPAAFTYKTGEVHWQLLIKARAVENLCYFVASAQGGSHQNGRVTWGHSCIVGPWGESLAQITTGEGFAIASLDKQKQMQLRKEFPVLRHKKL